MLKGMKRLFGAQDMTTGSPAAAMLLFSIPMLLGNFAQTLYGTVNAIIVGKCLGDSALAAVGICQPIQFLFFVFFMTIGTGVTVMVAQYFGAKEYKRLSECIGSSFTLIAAATVLIMCCAPLSGTILKLINTPPEIYDMTRDFLFVMFIGCMDSGFDNIISGILRGLVDTFFPLIVLLISVVLQVALDLLVILVFGWGLVGMGIVTAFSQLVSAIACLIKVAHLKGVVKIKRETLKPKKEMVMQIMRLGLPAGISQGIMSLSFVFVQSFMNAMGPFIITCMTSVMRVDQFAMLPNMAFNTAASTFTGQNIGANKMERVKKGGQAVVLMGFVAAVVIVALLLIFGKSLISMFTDTQDVIQLGNRMLWIMSLGYIANSFMQTYGGIMRGAGDTIATMWITIISNVILRVPLVYVWVRLSRSAKWPNGNPDSIYASMAIVGTVGAIMTFLYFRTGRWKSKGVIKRSEKAVEFAPTD